MSRRSTVLGTMMVMAAVGVTMAQTTPDTGKMGSRQTRSTAERVAAVGCLQKATNGYALTSARVGGKDPSSNDGAGTRLQVLGLREAELKSHVNAEVEVQGRLETDRTTPRLVASSIRVIVDRCQIATGR